ncbi:Bone morphogenetic protein 1 [Blomia tropicalis]|nr:Bone morphogenetic protein 1 [Blomia tropicalis]
MAINSLSTNRISILIIITLIVSNLSNTTRRSRAAISGSEYLWIDAVIPFVIEDNFNEYHRAIFIRAMRHWENFTCLRFVERNRLEHVDYIVFKKTSHGCCSFVGRQGNGRQTISIGKNCEKFGIVLHELGHVIGFWHEHTRLDRDDHVQIMIDNIVEGQEYNFNKRKLGEIDSRGMSYDYESIMHYARNTFSKQPRTLDTIRPRIDSPEIGQRIHLSYGDIEQTKRLYHCPKCGRSIQERSGTIESPNYHRSIVLPTIDENICEWHLTASHGERIELFITDIDIEESDNCKHGYLEVRDGYWQRSSLLGRFCGSGQLQHSLWSTGNRLLVRYKIINSPLNYRGFQASFNVKCGSSFINVTDGIIQSPNYPNEYDRNNRCIWIIIVPKMYQIVLTFESFHLEYEDNCSHDYVDVRDGDNHKSQLIGRFCGDRIRFDVRSSSNRLYIKFVSDNDTNNNYRGFSAKFIQEFDECQNQTYHGCQHKCINMIGGYRCECPIGFRLKSDGKQCEDAKCGGMIYIQSLLQNGSISSPRFDVKRQANVQCIWEIIAPESTNLIVINFTRFNLKPMEQMECLHESISIQSKSIIDQSIINDHGIYCGDQTPPIITSSTNVLRIEFQSNNFNEEHGFRFDYLVDVDECSNGQNGDCEHVCTNQIGSYRCECNRGYRLHSNGLNCVQGSCLYTITNSYQMFHSPNYPNPYPNNVDCTWYLSTIPGHRIKLYFLDFDLEHSLKEQAIDQCTHDHVTLYDGHRLDGSLLGQFCGKHRQLLTEATVTNDAHLHLQTDGSVQSKGFKAYYFTVCGGRMEATNQLEHIYSHVKYGMMNYPNNEDCDWQIVASNNDDEDVEQRIVIQFTSFDLEDEIDCQRDYVEIYDGPDDRRSSIGKFCGRNNPNEIISNGNSMLIRFHSDPNFGAKVKKMSLIRIGIITILFTIPFTISNRTLPLETNICRPTWMDCSHFGLSSRIMACLDCTEPIRRACGEPPDSCSIFHTAVCRGNCRPSIPGANKLATI